MKKNIVMAALLLVSVPAFSQIKQSEVVASAGGFESAQGLSVSYTVGEPVAGTLSAGGLTLVQGFQQGYALFNDTTSINPAIGGELANSVSIYPNPVRNFLNVDVNAAIQSNCIVKVFDMSGRMVVEQDNCENNRFTVDLSTVSQGAYLVKVYVDELLVDNKKIMKY